MQKPTIGRIVHYTLSEGDVEVINLRVPQHQGLMVRNTVAAGQTYPAMIVATFDGEHANLKVFLDGQGDYWATSRGPGDEPGTWAWPPRA